MNIKISPRQKMINLMYIVLMALLALNISPDLLNGFSSLGDAIHRMADGADIHNNNSFNHIAFLNSLNHEKVGEWMNWATDIKHTADSIFKDLETAKEDIATFADGDNAAMYNLVNKDDMEAAHRILLNPMSQRGDKLRQALVKYKKQIEKLPIDSASIKTSSAVLSTYVPSSTASWQEYWFGSASSTTAIAILSKLQGDVRYAEGIALTALYNQIDINDFRVNELNAFVIPEATTVMTGNDFKAKIYMAAVDTTAIPKIFIDGGKKNVLKDNNITIPCNSVGDFVLYGHLELSDNHGDTIIKSFSQPYKVIKPFATVAAEKMNMLYAGYENPISVSVPSMDATNIDLHISNGRLLKTQEPGRYIVIPSDLHDVNISVFANNKEIIKVPFRVRPLPEPSAYILINSDDGNHVRFKGGVINRKSLINSTRLQAAIDDDIMDIAFRVLDFEVVSFDGLGNAVQFRSNGEYFSAQQKQLFKTLRNNRRCYLSHIRVIGPENVERVIKTSMELIIR